MLQRKILAALCFALALACSGMAHAQIAPDILQNGCGTGASQNSLSYLTADTTLRLCVNATVTPSSAGGLTPSPLAPALATSQVIETCPTGGCNLYSFEVSADSTLSAAAWWILIFDATSDPGNGSVTPRKCYAQVSGATSAAYAWTFPIHFTTGIVIVVSTSGCFTETQSAHAFISGDAK